MNKIEEIIERVPLREVLDRYWGKADRAGPENSRGSGSIPEYC